MRWWPTNYRRRPTSGISTWVKNGPCRCSALCVPRLIPVDILQARVESRDVLMWEGETVGVFVVVYRVRFRFGAARCPVEAVGARRWNSAEAGSIGAGFAIGFHAIIGRAIRRVGQISAESEDFAWRHEQRGRGSGYRRGMWRGEQKPA